MIQIKTQGEQLDLPAGFSVEIEDSSPIFNERGSQSVPATVPATRRNIRLLGAPHRIDTGYDPNNPERSAEVISGGYVRSGVMNITEASKREGITFNIGFDNSTAYSKWIDRKLAELSDLPTLTPGDQRDPISWLENYFNMIYAYPQPLNDDFAIFPLTISKTDSPNSDSSNRGERSFWEILNVVTSERGIEQPRVVKRVINGEITEVTVPRGYCISPFLRVWRVLELIFADLGVTISGGNPFKKGELALLVVLNNAADVCCRGEVRYSELMPDCTVSEFLNALWVRFGLVYNINNDTGTVTLRFLKDILTSADRDLDPDIAGFEKITYETPQYVKLSAKTSIEGAAPATERFEDFIKGLDVSKVRMGYDVSQWTNTGTPEEPDWDGDLNDSWVDPYEPEDPEWPEPPEPDDDYWDDGDYDFERSSVKAATSGDTAVTTNSNTFLAREYITGDWYRLDSNNNTVKQASTAFFNWDPQPDGLTAFELNSDDECVPIDEVSNVGTGAGPEFNGWCPLFLAGARHYHSYIQSDDDDDTENSGDTTPLAFMFAYTKDQKSFGRINGEGGDGLPITLDDGTKPELSLLFQFKDGLFAKFWRFYDEILRHGNRSVEIPVRVNKLDMYDLLAVYRLKGIRCLIDTMTYSLPAGREIPVELKLRTIQTHGHYDIAKEQNIPDFSASSRHLEWREYYDGFEDTDTVEARREAAKNYISCYEYEPHGVDGDYWCVDERSAVFKSRKRVGRIWQNDPTMPAPAHHGQKISRTYRARLYYDIYEVHDRTDEENPGDYDLVDLLAEEDATVFYTVKLYAVWVMDK